MSDALFAMGVVGSQDDQPRQHRPKPVRCLEDELAPRIDAQPRCSDCGFLFPQQGAWLCGACERARQQRNKHKRRWHEQRAERMMLERLQSGGTVVAGPVNRHIVERLIAQGAARWLTKSERRQLGLVSFDNVAGPANRGLTGD